MPDLVPLRTGDPQRIREYRLTGRLGEGGQGTVYLGVSPTGARVAVKLLRPGRTQDGEATERFVREVGMAQRVAPFCTAAVIGTGVDRGRPYIVSEYIDGPTLEAVVTSEGPREGSALHRLAVGTVTALVAIHQAGVVHRDFKPSNVLLGPDGPRVIDFGIAKALDRTSTLTVTTIGTPSYMTPEQLAGEDAGPSADMFAWGATMIFAATGRPPFGVDSPPAIFNRIINLDPDLRAIADPALRDLIGQCLDKDAGGRPTAGEALLRLLGHPGGAPGAATPAAPRGILAEGSAAASPHPLYPARGEGPAKGRSGLRIAVGAGLAVALVAAGGITLALRGTPPKIVGPIWTGDTRDVTTSPSPDPVPAVSGPPRASRAIKLPGSSITVYESDDDPIRLSSYSLEWDKRLYVREPGSSRFTKNDDYFQYTVNASGSHALATGRSYDKRGYAIVSVVDRRSGTASRIRIARDPVYPTLPQWSPNGEQGLVTLYEVVGKDRKESREYGYAIIDIATKQARVVRVKEKDAGTWSYFWRGDGRAVGTWALTGETQRIRFYDLRGTVLQTLLDVGTPITVEGDDVSPSGSLLVTYCKGTEKEICIWSTAADGEAKARIPFETERLIGWYDDRHLAGWRKRGTGYEAVVIDFQGKAGRVLATSAEPAEYDRQFMRYTRGS
ncbi:Serine/threonine protein kinase [Streptosporangium subroseum]|uniref:non-specific serine/threonine protein kinase n=1 Tax=Streptosporangium subroseum TaxID=106412 RepID=A0A239A1P3_9ACTN|nr:serine/threonine-protein kinase [Streptosporangium subroseum]SNR89322.1 Serine/threonine protein kinase [Streptosporangium subroseum]